MCSFSIKRKFQNEKSPHRPTLFFFLVMIPEHNYLFVLALYCIDIELRQRK